MKIKDRVLTPHGIGVIIKKEYYSLSKFYRWGVELDENPFFYTPVYYYSSELEDVKN